LRQGADFGASSSAKEPDLGVEFFPDREHRMAETQSRRTREKRRYQLSSRLGKFREREKSSAPISRSIKEFASDEFGDERSMLAERRRISHQESTKVGENEK
jgi:hypothetical protein